MKSSQTKFHTVRVHYRAQTHVDKVDATATFGLYAKSEQEARELAKRAVEATAGNSSHAEVIDVADKR